MPEITLNEPRKKEYNGLKIVDLKQGEIRRAVKRFASKLGEARNVILIIEKKDGSLWGNSTCKEEFHTTALLDRLKHNIEAGA